MDNTVITQDELFEELGRPSQDPDADTYFPKSALGDIIERVVGEYEQAALSELLAAKRPGLTASLSEEKDVSVSEDGNVATGSIPAGYLPQVFDKVTDQDGNKLENTDDIDWHATVPRRTRYKYQIAGRDFIVLPKTTTIVKCYLIPTREAVELTLGPRLSEINQQIKKVAFAAVERVGGVAQASGTAR